MTKYIKYSLLLLILALLAYKSVYFEKISTRKNTTATAFDAQAFSKKLWDEKVAAKIESAVDLSVLISEMNKDREAAIKKYTNALAVGNYRYSLVKVSGTVAEINEDDILIKTEEGPVSADGTLSTASIATEFIYGNAVRDASAVVAIENFPNTADLSSISEELNKIIRTTVLPPFKANIKKGNKVAVVAAIEINKEHIHWQGIELLPLRLQILQ